MPFSGAGAIWDQETGTFIATNVEGSQAKYDAAKAAISAGIFYVGPGCEAIVLGSFGANQSLMLATANGIIGYTHFHVLDGTDPTKRLRFDVSGVGAGITRVGTIPDWSGVFLLPADFGVAGQSLKSSGPGAQPVWATGGSGINELLDGVNHTDTVAQAVTRGALIIGDVTPKWNRLPIGANGNSLVSDGNDPFWTAVQLLSSYHSDTLAATPVRGDLIMANATPAWARFAKGAADTILGSDGTDLQWRSGAYLASLVQSLIEHNALLHLKPFQVVGNVSMGAGSAILTDALTSGRFANVRIGDRINLDDAHYPSSTFGMVAISSGASDPNNITMSLTNTGGLQTGATATVYPGDHFDSALMAGLASSGGWGTYNAGTGTLETRYGPFEHRSYASGGAQVFAYEGLLSTGNLNDGFCVMKRGSTARVFHYAQALTAPRFFAYPDASGVAVLDIAVQTISGKTLQGNNEFQMDDIVGNINGSHFADVGDPSKELYFDLTGLTGGKKATFKNYSGNAVLASNEGASGDVLTSNGAGVAPSYQTPASGSGVSLGLATATSLGMNLQ